MTIRSRPATDEYRHNWDLIFGGKKGRPKRPGDYHYVEFGPDKDGLLRYREVPLSPLETVTFQDEWPQVNPHDAEEHPSAD